MELETVRQSNTPVTPTLLNLSSSQHPLTPGFYPSTAVQGQLLEGDCTDFFFVLCKPWLLCLANIWMYMATKWQRQRPNFQLTCNRTVYAFLTDMMFSQRHSLPPHTIVFYSKEVNEKLSTCCIYASIGYTMGHRLLLMNSNWFLKKTPIFVQHVYQHQLPVADCVPPVYLPLSINNVTAMLQNFQPDD